MAPAGEKSPPSGSGGAAEFARQRIRPAAAPVDKSASGDEADGSGGASRIRLEDWNLAFTDADFAFIAAMAHRHAGIDLSDKKRDMVYARLSKRVRSLGFSSFADYCSLLSRDEGRDEVGAAVNAITTNLTRFFREPHHFDHLHDVLSRQRATVLRSSDGRRRLRIWSAGCSTGEEAYSIAMTMASVIGGVPSSLGWGAGWDARILATDIDTDVLSQAAQGTYQASALKHVPADLRRDMLVSDADGSFSVLPQVRRLVTFKPLNLLSDWPMTGPFDAIFCRNVAIYFSRPDQMKLFSRLAGYLRDDGFLYIGHSENLFGVSDCFQLVARTIYRKLGQ